MSRLRGGRRRLGGGRRRRRQPGLMLVRRNEGVVEELQDRGAVLGRLDEGLEAGTECGIGVWNQGVDKGYAEAKSERECANGTLA